MSEIFLLTIFVLFIQIIFFRCIRKSGITFYTVFFLIYDMLVFIPFYLIYLDVQGVFELDAILGRTVDAKTVLSMGSGIRPLLLGITFSVVYFCVGEVFQYKNNHLVEKRNISSGKIFKFVVPIFIVAVTYTVIRYVFVPDFPLFALASGEKLRDIAFHYGSNVSVPWLFLPSINSQAYRIAIPFTFVFLLYLRSVDDRFRMGVYKYLFYISGTMAFVLSFGTFKRTPMLYLLTWLFVFKYGYTKIKVSKLIGYWILLFSLLLLITTFYSEDSSSAFRNMLSRFLVGEAIGEYLALTHFGSSFDYQYFRIPFDYVQKIFGLDVITFSERWKIMVGGSRGYTSIGVVAEVFVSIGWWSSIVFFPMTILIIKIDSIFRKYRSTEYWPAISGMIVVCSFMAVKGFFAQLFTGGVVTLVLIIVWQRIFYANRRVRYNL